MDSNEYYSDVLNAINNAEHEIFITDWWLSPELYLKRGVNQENEEDERNFRLDKVLKKASERGFNFIKIIIIFNKIYQDYQQNFILKIIIINNNKGVLIRIITW